MVGVLIVSHSKKAAEGIYELAVQMAGKDRKSTRLNSSHNNQSRMPSSA